MKTLLISCFLVLAAVPARATSYSYWGTITQTVISTNDPDYYVGEQFLGYYRYSSPTIDGDFYIPSGATNPPGANTSLRGSVYVTFPPEGPHNLSSTPGAGMLTVTGGNVSNFQWTFDVGGRYGGFTFAQFMTGVYNSDSGYPINWTTGTVTFSAATIPDSAPTGWLLLAGLGCCARLGRRVRRIWADCR